MPKLCFSANKSYHFLIVKMSSLGDILHALPVAKYIKEKFPKSAISWVVEDRFKDVLLDTPFVDTVIPLSIKDAKGNFFKIWKEISSFTQRVKKERFDVVFDLQGNLKSSLILALVKSKEKVGFSFSTVSEWPNAFFTNKRIPLTLSDQIFEQNLSFIYEYFKEENGTFDLSISLKETKEKGDFILEKKKPLFMVCPGSNWENKKLSEETLITFLQNIQEGIKASFVFIYGSEKERVFVEKLKELFPGSFSFGKLRITNWQAVMSGVDAVIAVDSSSLHLAAISNVPTFSIFGPSSLEVYKPKGKIHEGVQGVCPYNKTFVKHCNLLRTCKTGACIKEITVEKLTSSFLAFAEKVLKGNVNSFK